MNTLLHRLHFISSHAIPIAGKINRTAAIAAQPSHSSSGLGLAITQYTFLSSLFYSLCHSREKEMR